MNLFLYAAFLTNFITKHFRISWRKKIQRLYIYCHDHILFSSLYNLNFENFQMKSVSLLFLERLTESYYWMERSQTPDLHVYSQKLIMLILIIVFIHLHGRYWYRVCNFDFVRISFNKPQYLSSKLSINGIWVTLSYT